MERRRSRKVGSAQGTTEGRKAGRGPSSGHRAPPGAAGPGSPSPPGRRFLGAPAAGAPQGEGRVGTPKPGRRKANEVEAAWLERRKANCHDPDGDEQTAAVAWGT